MLSNELRYRVDEVENVTVDVNGFLYYRCKITVPGDIHLPGYISDRLIGIIEPGKYYHTHKAYITSMNCDTEKDAEVAFRIDSTTLSCEKKFLAEKETVVQINALIRKGPNNVIKYYGPMRIPNLCATAISHNEMGKVFYIMIMGFHSKAKILDDLEKLCYADITGVLTFRKPNKPCYIVVKDVYVRKEVK